MPGMMMVATANAVELPVAVHPSVRSPIELVPIPQKNIAGAPRARLSIERLKNEGGHGSNVAGFAEVETCVQSES